MERLKSLLSDIDKLKEELDSMRPFDKMLQQKVEQSFRLWWNYHSNAIEGNKLTLGETRNLILNGLTAKGKPIKDHTDIKGHNNVLLVLEDIVSDQERYISEHMIRELHEALLVEPYPMPSQTPDGKKVSRMIKIGQYKTNPNNVETSTGEIHFYTSPEMTPSAMSDLIDWYRKACEKSMHPVLIAAEFHYKFVCIHPFDDGNGRMSRILMNMILLKFGYVPAILKISDRNTEYIPSLEEADAGNQEPFYEYIAKCELEFIEKYINGLKGIDIKETDDIDKRLELFDKTLEGIESEIGNGNGYNLSAWVNSISWEVLHEVERKFQKYFESERYACVSGKKNDDYDFYTSPDEVVEEALRLQTFGVDEIVLIIQLNTSKIRSVKSFDVNVAIALNFKNSNPQIYFIQNDYRISVADVSNSEDEIENLKKIVCDFVIDEMERKTKAK